MAARTRSPITGGDSGQGLRSLGLEAAVNDYGVAAAMPQG